MVRARADAENNYSILIVRTRENYIDRARLKQLITVEY
jgi:hypothetical protein